ncbi:type II CRISPR-associated endonuclease Cas1 [Paracoccus bogoriensis]|uniref:type II CRISPR-associated endonuclease Cas1 n=1 Tax=Paracoccus bogoriensis TaxID=242065 RepID=UPI001CA4AAEA|nr:type II CRISPR-associated endonuclease Cas1 [Paracoccus bogoriensis]MBW7057792.1 type II CRISPR-associated endonuclease Cas1 [Paracoccus bogoriensis]
MVGRILELTATGLSVHKRRGFLAVETGAGEAGRIAFDDLEAVLVASPAMVWSNSALAELAARQVPVMVLGPDFNPAAVFLPLAGHFRQAHRIRAQADASVPFRKQAWATLVRHKILAQAEALERVNAPSERLRRLAMAVRSGDPDNREAQAAQAYWPLMMDKAFRRDRQAVGANALLNYGYAVLRAATARAIVSAGLHPSLSVHHRSGGDALALADDLMEPFRPTVDLIVRSLCAEGITEVAEARGALVASLSADFPTPQGASPLSQVLVRLAQSLAQSCETGKLRLVFPDRPIPLAAEDLDDE